VPALAPYAAPRAGLALRVLGPLTLARATPYAPADLARRFKEAAIFLQTAVDAAGRRPTRPTVRPRRAAGLLLFLCLAPGQEHAAGQGPPTQATQAAQPASPISEGAATPLVDGRPVPVPPAVIVRDDAGHATLRAVLLTSALRVDGQLDEAIYEGVPAISDFIQNDPEEGAPATEKTEVWIFFDRDALYVVARCWETRPERVIANEMRRDSTNIVQNDGFAFALDTFHDRRNSVVFEVNAIGGRIDAQVTNERQVNMDWNPIWDFKLGRFEHGWTLETAIPFKSLRYQPGRAQVWGFNARRINRWKNEVSYLVAIPSAMTLRGHFQASLMPVLIGIEAPSGSRNLEIKPYAISQLTTDRTVAPERSNEVGGDFGVDAKYGITQSLTADFTYNTDFAQVEADEQQVNLTRFSLFFPEKRDFFLENQGTFAFGGGSAFGPAAGGGGGSGGSAAAAAGSDTPLLFYSRRIGLDAGRAVPIEAGGRLTGRAGRYTLGVLNIQSDDDAAVAAAAPTGRSVAEHGRGANAAFGVDSTLAFFDNLAINTYWARTRTEGLDGDDTSYRAQLDYAGDRYGVQIERLAVGEHFNPEVGFLRRADMRRSFGLFRFSPRPQANTTIRRYSALTSMAYIENGAGHLETRDWDGELAMEFQNSDRLFVAYSNTYEFLPTAFNIASGITLPVGGYDFASVRAGFTLGQQRRVAGSVSIEHGTFYSGDKTAVSWSRGRVNLTPQLSFEPRVSIDRVELAEGAFTSRLIGSRVTYTMTPLMFVSALVQYSSATEAVSGNVRLRWEYRPGSELFVVWNEQRETVGRRFPELTNRAFVVKINRMLRF
jgi:hypothetical protein